MIILMAFFLDLTSNKELKHPENPYQHSENHKTCSVDFILHSEALGRHSEDSARHSEAFGRASFWLRTIDFCLRNNS
jgi:hypothetical protein